MKKLETKSVVVGDALIATSANRIKVSDFSKGGLLTWINTIIRPFGIQLVSDSEANALYPVRTSFRISSESAQANMCIGIAKFVKAAATWLPDETKKSCEGRK